MKKVFKIFLIVMAVIAIIIQFIPSKLPETKSDNPDDLLVSGTVSNEVAIILKTSCYDCHSNQIKYPWYSYVAPVSWLLKHDIEEGRDELNFSEWQKFPKRRVLKKLDEIGEMVEEGEMPLPIYTFMHGDATLSPEQKKLILNWATQESSRIAGN